MKFPAFPKNRYGIFAGTNCFDEWKLVLTAWFHDNLFDVDQTIKQFETEVAAYIGSKKAFSFGAGRMALYAILRALEIGEGDEVIIPAFTCVVVPNAIIYRGAKPIYADIDPHTFNIDVNSVEKLIGPKTRALYAQHTFGVPCDLNPLKELGEKYKIPVVEDCAHALGAKYGNRFVGGHTEVSYFSTDHSKNINTQLGGVALTNDPDLAKKLQLIQKETPFLNKNYHRKLLKTFLLEYFIYSPQLLWLGRSVAPILSRLGIMFYFGDELFLELPTGYPYPCRLSSIQAQIGLSQISHIDENLFHRRRIAFWLEKQIRWYGFDFDHIEQCAWLRYPFLVKNREEFERRFLDRFDLGIWFTSITAGRSKNFEEIGYEIGSCPRAEFAARHIVNFPTHPRVSFEVIEESVSKNLDWIECNLLTKPFL